jgi:hypothetical protein
MPALIYNLFRNRRREDLCCAVPEDRVVPVFVTHEGWIFAGRVRDPAERRGFDGEAAREGSRLNGFYVFQEVR